MYTAKMIILYLKYNSFTDAYSGNVGLAITQSIGLIGLFQWGMRRSVELENQMASVERVLEYTSLPREPALESPESNSDQINLNTNYMHTKDKSKIITFNLYKTFSDKKPPKKWPDKGRITFSNFFLRYDINTPYVLSNLNINIEPREKVIMNSLHNKNSILIMCCKFRLELSVGLVQGNHR